MSEMMRAVKKDILRTLADKRCYVSVRGIDNNGPVYFYLTIDGDGYTYRLRSSRVGPEYRIAFHIGEVLQIAIHKDYEYVELWLL